MHISKFTKLSNSDEIEYVVIKLHFSTNESAY